MSSKSNVIVIGGGAIGLCSAYYLSKSGAQVTVIDKGEFGHGSSLHNAGYVCPSHFIPLASPGIISQGLKWMLSPTSPFYIKPRLDPDFIRWAWHFKRSCTKQNVEHAMPLLRDLGVASLALYKEFAAMKAFDFGWTEKGLLTLFRSERSKRHYEEEAKMAHTLGIRSQMLTKSELQTLVPEVEVRAEGGLYFPDDCHMTPAKFVQGLAECLEKNGVRLVRNTRVSGFKVQGDRIVEIETSKGNFSADEFVLAGGSWSPDIVKKLGIKLLIQAGKGYSVTIERTERKPAIPLIFSEARVAVTPMGSTIRFAGTMEIAGLDTSITHRRVDAILSAIPNYIGGYDKSDFTKAEPWAGLRPVSPDGLPYIGRFKKYPNLIGAAGHAMVGISLATVTGKLVEEIALGNKPDFDLTLLNPDRFN